VPSCTYLGGNGQFSQAFSGEVYDFYSVSPEYFGYTLVYHRLALTQQHSTLEPSESTGETVPKRIQKLFSYYKGLKYYVPIIITTIYSFVEIITTAKIPIRQISGE
jgi:hypothetical protein